MPIAGRSQLEPAFGEAWWSLANLKTVPLRRGDDVAMQRNWSATTWPRAPLQLEFALGKALEDAADYADSFGITSAATPAQASAAYRAEEHRARAPPRTFTREFFAARAGYGAMRRSRSSSSACRAPARR
jgi:hypothetical protein